MTHLSRFAFKRATSEKWSYQHHHGWQLGRDRGRGRGGGRGNHAADAGALLVHKGCWHLLDIALSCVERRRAKECSRSWYRHTFHNLLSIWPAWYLQHICLTLKWPICQSFQTHFNTERYYNTFRLYLFAVNMLEGHQPAGGVARYTTSLLRIMLCHMSEITPPTESALLGSYYSYEQIKSLQVGVANVKSAVVCVWHLIKDVVSSHHQQTQSSPMLLGLINIYREVQSCKSKIFGKFCIHSKAICFIIRTS